MKVAFDLDGTLDRKVLADLCKILLDGGHEVSVITGVFSESGAWQGGESKRLKLSRLGIPFNQYDELEPVAGFNVQHVARLFVLESAPTAAYTTMDRLRDIGLRKGALCERLGVQMFFDDSSIYCEMVPKMSGDTLTLKVGESK